MTDLTLPLLAQEAGGLSFILESLRSGGFVMLLIVLCSVAATSVAIISWLRMREHLLMPMEVERELRSIATYATKGDIRPLHKVLEENPSVLATLGMMVVSGQFTSKQECQEVLAQKAKEEIYKLDKDMPFLEVMVSAAPLLGLLGTTIGLVGMFSAFGDGGSSGPDTAAIAKEIGVALRCTIAGLLVAVPTVIAHTWFVRKLDGISMRLETILQDSINSFYQHFEVQRSR